MEKHPPNPFIGWRVVAAAFILATFGWGIGFYGPSVYLHTIQTERGWPVALVSAAVTVHFLVGAIVVANLPTLYRRYGLPAITKAGAVTLAFGVVGWAVAAEPWQLFVATLLSGAGWVCMGAAAINAIISPWFIVARPKALSMAYNGASVGGIVFAPLWVATIATFGFPWATASVGLFCVLVVWFVTDRYFAKGPADLGQAPDGGASAFAAPHLATERPVLSGRQLWINKSFCTLAAGMALGLFAQIGVLAHLVSLIAPALGAAGAGLALALATASAIAGRTIVGWVLRPDSDRRLAACASYAVQAIGLVVLILGADTAPAVLAAVILFGFGIGNATSIPPLIAQQEFAAVDTPRVVALIVAIGQGTYAFAPMVFGALRSGVSGSFSDIAVVGAAAILLQLVTIGAFLAGRRRAG